MSDSELIAEVQGKKVYVTKEFKESLKKLGLTPEQEKELIDDFLRQLAKTLPSKTEKEE